MDDTLKIACRALQIGTKGHRLSFILDEWRFANWTKLGQMIYLLLTCTPLDDGFYYLWYYFACSFDKHPVTNAQVFALNVAFIVKCSARNCYTANIDGLK